MRLTLQNLIADECVCTCLVTHAETCPLCEAVYFYTLTPSVQAVCKSNVCHTGKIAWPAGIGIALTSCLFINVMASSSPPFPKVQPCIVSCVIEGKHFVIIHCSACCIFCCNKVVQNTMIVTSMHICTQSCHGRLCWC